MAKNKGIAKLLEELEPKIRAAFLEAINDITSAAQLSVIAGALERGDIESAVKALNLDRAFFEPLDEAMRAAYIEGGKDALAGLPAIADNFRGGTITSRFDVRNIRAERYLSSDSSRRIKAVAEPTKKAARKLMTEALAKGRSPRAVALDLVGTVNRKTGKRSGGIIGLAENQAQWVLDAGEELSTATGMRKYKGRSLSTKRDRATINKALKQGRDLTKAEQQRIKRNYQNAVLKYRGETIARTELLQSLHASQNEAADQLVENGRLSPDAIVRIWDASEDGDTRPSHSAMDGDKRSGTTSHFTTGNGHPIRYPGDPNAPAEEIINCRCIIRLDVDFISELGNG